MLLEDPDLRKVEILWGETVKTNGMKMVKGTTVQKYIRAKTQEKAIVRQLGGGRFGKCNWEPALKQSPSRHEKGFRDKQ